MNVSRILRRRILQNRVDEAVHERGFRAWRIGLRDDQLGERDNRVVLMAGQHLRFPVGAAAAAAAWAAPACACWRANALSDSTQCPAAAPIAGRPQRSQCLASIQEAEAFIDWPSSRDCRA